MENFKDLLKETLADNQIESLLPSREYSENERIYMRGYTAALSDMLDDFNSEFSEFKKTIFTQSLN